METLSVGMYVRTNEGKITKLIEIDKDGFKRFDELVDFTNYEITKASHNIIDLIEVGDYVNGHRVEEINFEDEEIFTNSEYYCGIVEFCNIKSVITHEQMEQIVYRVEK